MSQVLMRLVEQIGQGDRGGKSVPVPSSQAGNNDTVHEPTPSK